MIKSLIIPILTCLASVQEINATQIKQLNTKIYAFVWNNKPDKVNRSIMINRIEKGGMNIRDIESH